MDRYQKHFLKPAFIITIFCLLGINSSIIAIDMLADRAAVAKGQIESIATLTAKIDAIRVEFQNDKAAFRYGLYEFCSTQGRPPGAEIDAAWPDPSCDEKSLQTRVDEAALPVHYIAYGWVLEGDEAPGDDYNSIYGYAAGTDAFQVINSTSETFNDHLCVEIHFKDTSQYKDISLSLNNKTVVICARSADTTAELIDIDMVDSDPSDGAKISHNTIAPGRSGWACFNPHNSLNNGGQAMGYTMINGKAYRLIPGINNLFSNCFPARDTVNN